MKRGLEELVELGLVTVDQEHRTGGGTTARFTLHYDEWSGGPSRTSAMVHGEARAVVHGEAPTTSTPIDVGEHSQEPPNPPQAGGGELVLVSESAPIGTSTFDDWYARWPKKQGKAAAKRCWQRLTMEEKVAVVTITAEWIEWAARHPEGNQYVPMASTFLNPTNRRWEDELPPLPRRQATRGERNAAVIEAMRHGARPNNAVMDRMRERNQQ